MTTSRPTILEVHTQSPQEVIDITAQVESLLGDASGGSCHLYLAHTTAGLMVVTSEAVRDGRLALGEFQRVVLLEFEGPRRRRIEVHRLAAWTETAAGA
jgi:thiamine phosphate synthase YjbQ (UPF0047 family)